MEGDYMVLGGFDSIADELVLVFLARYLCTRFRSACIGWVSIAEPCVCAPVWP